MLPILQTMIQQQGFRTIHTTGTKQLLHVAKKNAIIYNAHNMRLWWKEGKLTRTLSIVYKEPKTVLAAAEIMKTCQVIDSFEPIYHNGELLSVRLFKGDEPKVFDGMLYYVRKEVKCHHLDITAVDVLNIASCITAQREQIGKVIPMFKSDNHTKNAA